jgi:hypothetical protein
MGDALSSKPVQWQSKEISGGQQNAAAQRKTGQLLWS